MSTCETCGGPLVQAGRGRPKAKFCSPECKSKAVRERKRTVILAALGERRCRACGKVIPAEVTLRAKCCSRACNYAWQNQLRAEAKRERMLAARKPCQQCGGEIPETRRSGSIFCSPTCKKKATDARWRPKMVTYNRRRLYGMGQEEFNAMLAAQGGVCVICGTDQWNGKDPRPHVDHDHVTGRIRGLLCNSCNNGLGRFGDDPARLRAAAGYLERALTVT